MLTRGSLLFIAAILALTTPVLGYADEETILPRKLERRAYAIACRQVGNLISQLDLDESQKTATALALNDYLNAEDALRPELVSTWWELQKAVNLPRDGGNEGGHSRCSSAFLFCSRREAGSRRRVDVRIAGDFGSRSISHNFEDET